DLDEVQIGMILSFATLCNMALTIPIGYMIDYHGRKSVILKSLYVTSAASLLFTFSSDFLTMSLVALILGIGTSGSQQAPLAMATDVTINEPRGLSIGLYRIFNDIGFIVGPMFLGFLADSFNLVMPFYFMSMLLLVNAVLILVFAKETYSIKKNQKMLKKE
ncbi:MFS transporter, partial [Candidatus Bathyarchaeota archaeon]|nr:MFS transporter [Candidatus Bathyarchaeota archaeon]